MFLPTKQFSITYISAGKDNHVTAKGFSDLFNKLHLIQGILFKGGDISSLTILEVM